MDSSDISNAPPLSICLDSGAPEGSADYTTVVIVHGFMWHGEVFKKLLPLGPAHNARVIAVNRRDYPGSAPTSEADAALLKRVAGAPEDPARRAELRGFWRDRAREVFDLLVELVRTEHLPETSGAGSDAKGGIVVAGWSFGSVWMSTLLAHLAEFSAPDIQLSRYLRRVVLYDPSHYFLGGAPPAMERPQPLSDESIPTWEGRVRALDVSLLRYHPHVYPVTPEGLAHADVTESADPSPTVGTEGARHAPPDDVHWRDVAIFGATRVETFWELKEAAFYPTEAEVGEWDGLEVRYLWCDRSPWMMPWGAHIFGLEVEKAWEEGRKVRDIRFVRFKGANHFPHWDFPEKTMRGFLSDESEIS